MTLKPGQIAKIDQQTPKWPELKASLQDPPTIVVYGVTTALVADDPQAEIVHLALEHVRRNGKPIRVAVTQPNGAVDRIIVLETGAVVTLDHAVPATAISVATDSMTKPAVPAKTKSGKKAKAQPSKTAKKSGKGFFGSMSPRAAAALKIGGATLIALVLVAITGLIIKNNTEEVAVTAAPPAPVAAQLYTDLAPPGWSQQAAWAIPIGAKTAPYTDSESGFTVVLSATDQTLAVPTLALDGNPAQHEAKFLNVLGPDGRAVFATEISAVPKEQPTITTIDGNLVVLITDGKTISYWPLPGGAATPVQIEIPRGAKFINEPGTRPMLTVSGDRLGYIHNGTVQLVQGLPYTEPAFAADGAVIVTQPETGTWWTLRTDTAPSAVSPAAPGAGYTFNEIIGITSDVALISWLPPVPAAESKVPDTVTVVAYDTATGNQITATSAEESAVQAGQLALSSSISKITAAGSVTLAGNPAELSVSKGFAPEVVADAVYGALNNDIASVDSNGQLTPLPNTTLTPAGYITGHLLVVSQNTLYALNPLAPSGG